MSLSHIKSLVENYSKVCRFCLQSNSQDLGNLYEQITGKADIVTINTTVRSVLTILGIQITQNDVYPNLICGSCRDLLHSIQNFRERVQKSMQLLDQARLLKEFPNAKFDDEPSEVVKEKIEFEEPTALDVAYEVMVASNGEDVGSVAEDTEETVTLDGGDEVKLEVDVEGIEPEAASEYAETEWVVYDECEQNEQQQADETEEVYVDEEYIQESLSDEDRVSATSEVTQMLHGEEDEEMEEEEEEAAEGKEELPETIQPPPNKNCPICGVTSTAMAVHMRTHTKIRPFTCGTCEKKFYTNAKLRSHIESVHIGERKFSCEICGKAFVLRKTLNAHMMSHVAEKAFVCSVCSKGFLFRWALVKHERVHTGERPYVCTLDGCGKKFATSSNLSQHQKTNTHWKNPREDICQECGKSFQNKYALRAHLRSHHGAKIVGNSE